MSVDDQRHVPATLAPGRSVFGRFISSNIDRERANCN